MTIEEYEELLGRKLSECSKRICERVVALSDRFENMGKEEAERGLPPRDDAYFSQITHGKLGDAELEHSIEEMLKACYEAGYDAAMKEGANHG